MSFFNEVAIYFTGMSWLVALLMVLGFALILIELFQNGFGIFGVIGAVVIALGIVLRVSVGDGVIYAQIFISIFIESIAVLIAFLVLLKTGKAGWLRRSPIVESTESHTEVEQIGEYGTALTDIAPIGVANIEGEVKDVVTESFNIAQGENLKVSHTEDDNNKIVVEKID